MAVEFVRPTADITSTGFLSTTLESHLFILACNIADQMSRHRRLVPSARSFGTVTNSTFVVLA